MTPEKYIEMYGNILFLDIETVSNQEMIKYIPEPAVPGNYKDLAKIEAHKEAAKAKLIEKAALDIDYAQIRCIGIAENYNKPTVLLSHNIEEEKQILGQFWGYMNDLHKYCGYNLRHFDFPIILRRSWALGITPCRRIQLTRNNPNIIDLMQLLYHEGYGPIEPSSQRWRRLSLVCKMYGIDNPMPDVDGSMVAGMTDEELIKYNTNDIELTQKLAKKTEGYYWGELPVYKKETVNAF